MDKAANRFVGSEVAPMASTSLHASREGLWMAGLRRRRMARLVRMAGGIVDGRTLGAPPMPQTEQELAAVAHSQRGLLTRQQCLSAGMSDRAIRWRLVKGRWTCVHHGVYLTTPERDDWYTTALAAQLAVSDSAWSHRTAAHVHGLIRESPAIIELVVDRERRVAEPAGTKLHRRVSVNRAVDELHWPCRTTVEETILDVSRKGSSDELMAMLGRAFQRSRTSEASLRAALATRRAHPWRELLELILAEVAAPKVPWKFGISTTWNEPMTCRSGVGSAGR